MDPPSVAELPCTGMCPAGKLPHHVAATRAASRRLTRTAAQRGRPPAWSSRCWAGNVRPLRQGCERRAGILETGGGEQTHDLRGGRDRSVAYQASHGRDGDRGRHFGVQPAEAREPQLFVEQLLLLDCYGDAIARC